MWRRQSGFTLWELLALLCSLAFFGVVIAAGYALIHFIAKFW